MSRKVYVFDFANSVAADWSRSVKTLRREYPQLSQPTPQSRCEVLERCRDNFFGILSSHFGLPAIPPGCVWVPIAFPDCGYFGKRKPIEIPDFIIQDAEFIVSRRREEGDNRTFDYRIESLIDEAKEGLVSSIVLGYLLSYFYWHYRFCLIGLEMTDAMYASEFQRLTDVRISGNFNLAFLQVERHSEYPVGAEHFRVKEMLKLNLSDTGIRVLHFDEGIGKTRSKEFDVANVEVSHDDDMDR
jgi:hypothetical protein